MTLTAADLIQRQKAFLRADNERMNRRPSGTPRYSWRVDNPIDPVCITAGDTAFKTRPTRILTFDVNGSATDLWVWRSDGKVIERIDLNAPDADARLARYEED